MLVVWVKWNDRLSTYTPSAGNGGKRGENFLESYKGGLRKKGLAELLANEKGSGPVP